MKCFITGGSGFVGQHLAKRLLAEGHEVLIYDRVPSVHGLCVCADIQDVELLTSYMKGHDIVFHLASNADIAASAKDPVLDFREGTQLTQKVLEAMRVSGVRRLCYFSGSGVYGESPGIHFKEDHGPLMPISPYGASKLASEALVSAYCNMFDMTAVIFRPANIVGPGQTHGVGCDFIRRLREDPTKLKVLGDGFQFKSYIHIDDVLNAVIGVGMSYLPWKIAVFNVGSDGCMSVRSIANMATKVMGLIGVQIEYGASDRGWNGDVPKINLDCSRLAKSGWHPIYSSSEAMHQALTSCSHENLLKS